MHFSPKCECNLCDDNYIYFVNIPHFDLMNGYVDVKNTERRKCDFQNS